MWSVRPTLALKQSGRAFVRSFVRSPTRATWVVQKTVYSRYSIVYTMQREVARRLLRLAQGRDVLRASLAETSLPSASARYASAAVPQPAPVEEAVIKIEEPLRLPETSQSSLTPKQICALLDKHIVGQADAKKAVANALRSRWRRRQVPAPLREEIVPKNILMLGGYWFD